MQKRTGGRLKSAQVHRLAPCALFILHFGLISCTSGPSAPDESAYLQEIEAHRARIEKAFRESDDPIPPQKRDILLPLRYYQADAKYAVPAELRLFESRETVEVPTSTGTVRRMDVVGTLNFTLDGQQMSLGALVPAGTGQIQELFVPFADLTTGKDTYKAGATMPVKFALADAAGTRIPDAEAQAIVSSCRAKVRLDSGTPGCASYNPTTDTFQFNLNTLKNLSKGTHTITLDVFVGANVVATKSTTTTIK